MTKPALHNTAPATNTLPSTVCDGQAHRNRLPLAPPLIMPASAAGALDAFQHRHREANQLQECHQHQVTPMAEVHARKLGTALALAMGPGALSRLRQKVLASSDACSARGDDEGIAARCRATGGCSYGRAFTAELRDRRPDRRGGALCFHLVCHAQPVARGQDIGTAGTAGPRNPCNGLSILA